ncbi:hypothetical protein [Sphingomicrobium astaxanthinifaciens]|uniref:hypothetical protein n=1 Tax=Sphingomicrobium astaxanthinifaciens TaxID=1227949 RepID=UPI001FCB3F76|nr:hypothetical protein [Sphingomicrobium astaxanthinifaciens]MCJ7420541.1 hypothetical protein [Sphingomicrobium astaxanthinifaciens]
MIDVLRDDVHAADLDNRCRLPLPSPAQRADPRGLETMVRQLARGGFFPCIRGGSRWAVLVDGDPVGAFEVPGRGARRLRRLRLEGHGERPPPLPRARLEFRRAPAPWRLADWLHGVLHPLPLRLLNCSPHG